VELAVETSDGAIGFMKGALASLFAQTPSLEKDFEKVSVQAVSAFDEFSRYLKEHLLESCSGSYAVGRDRFEFLLKEEHMLEFDANSLLEFGEYWIREAEKELREVAGQIDPNKNWSDIIDQYKGDHPEATRLISFYREKIERGKRFVMEKDLVRLPDEEYLDVVPTPDFERAFLKANLTINISDLLNPISRALPENTPQLPHTETSLRTRLTYR